MRLPWDVVFNISIGALWNFLIYACKMHKLKMADILGKQCLFSMAYEHYEDQFRHIMSKT